MVFTHLQLRHFYDYSIIGLQSEDYRKKKMLYLNKICSRLILTVFAAIISFPALAHHPIGGTTPTNLGEGLLSGIGHPIIGIDHLAFVVGVGIAASFVSRGLLVAFFFIATTVFGSCIHLLAVHLPNAEIVVACSVLLLGIMIAMARRNYFLLWGSFFMIAGFFHGYAYGESIVGAETTPLLAYLVGFFATQSAIATGAFLISLKIQSKYNSPLIGPRIAGGIIAGVGSILIFINILTY